MENYSQKELDATLQFISSTISKCEKMQLKFAEQVESIKSRPALFITCPI